jgi:hypothetical protein
MAQKLTCRQLEERGSELEQKYTEQSKREDERCQCIEALSAINAVLKQQLVDKALLEEKLQDREELLSKRKESEIGTEVIMWLPINN